MPIQASRTRVLLRSFFDRDPVTVARELLGALLCHDDRGLMLVGRIVETEAYLAADDPASHGYRGQTSRNVAMFGSPGHAYVYAMHRYHCLNVVTQGEGVPSAILLRAVEPLQGMEVMFPRRRTERYTNLASGPGSSVRRSLSTVRWINGTSPKDAACGWQSPGLRPRSIS